MQMTAHVSWDDVFRDGARTIAAARTQEYGDASSD
jgi:hypothetical protein